MPRSNSRERMAATRALVLSLIVVASAAPVGTQATTPQDPNAAVFKYNPHLLTDEQFRDLVDAIAEYSDVSTWPKIRVVKDDGLLSIVDRAYDFYLSSRAGSKEGAKPLTAIRLTEIIRDKNGLKSDALQVNRELSIPPIVARPSGTATMDQFHGFINVSPGDKGTDVYWNQSSHEKRDPKGPVFYNTNMASHKWNAAVFTELGMRMAETITVRLPEAKAQQLMSAKVGAIVTKERVAMELLQGPDCLAPFTESPYQALAKQELEGALPELLTRAAAAPLIIIDYDFQGGHGSKVRSVVDKMLDGFGVGKLQRFVRNFDLNPKSKPAVGADPHPLVAAMELYSMYLLSIDELPGDARLNASDWLLFPNPASNGGLTIPIAPFVLQAAIQTSIAQGAWLNMSWRGDRTDWVLPIDFEQLLLHRNTFAVVAAGNELEDIKADRSPQDASARFSKFVNVTSGTAAGLTCGSRTGSQGGRVHLMAQGLSVDAATGKTVSGSSYASPVVATAAWLKHLLDRTPAQRMREKLVAASNYVPAHTVRTVDAKGVFDPAKLIVGLGPHYIDANNGSRVNFTSMQLDAAACGLYSHTKGEATQDLTMFERNGTWHLAVRSSTEEFPHVKERDLCTPTAMTFSVTLSSGEVKTVKGVAEFAQLVGHLHF